MSTKIIGIGEMDVVRAPEMISTLGLGSCCGVVLYDPTTKVAGMVHVLLPTAVGSRDTSNKAKFADMGVIMLLDRVMSSGARRATLTAKLAGGAHMFASTTMQSDLLKVGERNVAYCKDTLVKLRIPLMAEDTLGTYGRTIVFDPSNGKLQIRTVGKGEKFI